MPKTSSSLDTGSLLLTSSLNYNANFARLRREQLRSLNITTFDPYPSPGHMREVPYPRYLNGNPIPPKLLWRYSTTHQFDVPLCFHALDARMFTVSGSGRYSGLTVAACGHQHRAERCSYWVCFDEIVQHAGIGLVTDAYAKRQPELPLSIIPYEFPKETPSTDAPAPSQVPFQFLLPDGRVNPLLHSNDKPRFHDEQSSSPSSSVTLLDPPMAETSAKGKAKESTSFSVLLSKPSSSKSPFLKCSLPFPNVDSAEHDAALSLLPAGSSFPSSPVRYTTPPRGNFRCLLDLMDDVGIPATEFWSMFVLCRGCNHIMAGHYLSTHTCDLTNLDK